MKNKVKLILLISIIIVLSCSNEEDIYELLIPEENEAFSGGENTIFDISVNAFGFQSPNLKGDNSLFFFTGNSLFNQNWVTAPASTSARDGLGPFFNARACSSCHFKDGRGRAPQFNGELNHGLLLQLSIPGTLATGEHNPEPIYGGQLQDQSVPDAATEGIFNINYLNKIVNYPDGSTTILRAPKYTITNLNHGDIASNVQISPRVAQQMVGLGLLEAISEKTLLDFADPNDLDGDGISGKPNYVWNRETKSKTIGRFGWKANQPTLKQQISAAFAGDLGITSTLFPDENCPEGVNCTDFPNGGTPEISDENVEKVTLYASTLAVPGRRDVDEQHILEGKKFFNDSKCSSCHIPKITTATHTIPALANQTIRPYTDLLLHDMGSALADNTPDFEATGKEWRTSPLWGIGLIETVNGHTNLLHDGRARTIEEAILWHSGEAESSKNAFMNLSITEREKLLAFIKSL